MLAGITTGAAATLSMTCAEFLLEEVDDQRSSSVVSAAFTGIDYLLVAAILLAPYFIFASPWAALSCCLVLAIFLIFILSIAVSQIRHIYLGKFFQKIFWMSSGVALISFLISWSAYHLRGIQAQIYIFMMLSAVGHKPLLWHFLQKELLPYCIELIGL